jgi:P4 family phage/plasmid primase-like protien
MTEATSEIPEAPKRRSRRKSGPQNASGPEASVTDLSAARNRRRYRNRTDYGNAERLIDQSGRDLLHLRGQWYVWDGGRFRLDETGAVQRLAKRVVRGIYREASEVEDSEDRRKLAKHAVESESSGRISAMISLASTELDVVVESADDLDADPWSLNCANGTIDLRTGALREHDRDDRITRSTGIEYDPNAGAPRWAAFLARILPDAGARGFVQRVIGYSLTGLTSEHKLFIFNGGGANGKSTFIETVMAVMGDYAMASPPDLLVEKKSGGIPNDVAALRGARLVSAMETEDGARLKEVRVKELTAGDKQSARYLHKEFFTFKPQAKFIVATNHRPIVHGSDEAIWRRMSLIPFDQTIPASERDKGLSAKLRAELPGILAWAVRGCVEWQQSGLAEPSAILAATGDYRAEQDLLGTFIDDVCFLAPDANIPVKVLYGHYRMWCENSGHNPQGDTRFGQRLAERDGITRGRTKSDRLYLGIRLREHGEPRQDFIEPASVPAEPVVIGCAQCRTASARWCGPGKPAIGERAQCVCGCGELTILRSACGAPRITHGDLGGETSPADPGPEPTEPAPDRSREPRPTAPGPVSAPVADKPAAATLGVKRTVRARSRAATQRAATEAAIAGLAQGHEPNLINDLAGAFAPRRGGRELYRTATMAPPVEIADVFAGGYRWQRAYRGDVTVLDRSGSWISSAASVTVALGELAHTGTVDYAGLPGYYQIQVQPWTEDAMPSPLGAATVGTDIWVPQPVAGLLADLADAGRWPDVAVLDSHTSDEPVRLSDWTGHINALRTHAVETYGRDSDEYQVMVKGKLGRTISTITGKRNAGQSREWECAVKRTDIAHAIQSHSAVMMWRWADDCRAVAPEHAPVGLRGTDELCVPSEAVPVITTKKRPGGRKPIQLDDSGLTLGTFKVKGIETWTGEQ